MSIFFQRRNYSAAGFIMAAAICFFAGAQTFPHRDIRFSANWKFMQADVAGATATTFNDSLWTTVCLPHTAHLESALSIPNYGYWKGNCEYRKTFIPDPAWRGKKVFLEFEGAMQTDTIWVNGIQKLVYLGGYNPFSIDITGDLQYGVNNVIAVVLNNNVNTNVSPGEQPDFFFYGGLYRDVNIHLMDSLHITDAVYANKIAGGGVFVTDSAVSTTSAIVNVKTDVLNEGGGAKNCMLTTTLIDSIGGIVQMATSPVITIAAGKDSTFSQSLAVANPRLWSPSSPYLYRVISQVYDGSTPADSMSTIIGIKTVSFSKAGGFLLNGTRIIARGANRHQDYGGLGNAVPASGQYRDALRLKEAGFNWVRCSHYLQNHAFIDACDKLGIMVEPALVGWQYTAGYTNATFAANLRRDLHTLVHYFRNHPSIVCWESAMNESSPPAAWLDTANAIVHSELPSPRAYTVGQQAGSCGTSLNILDIYQAAVQRCGRTPTGVSTAYGVSEYGHREYGGFTSTSMQTRANLDAGMLIEAGNHSAALSTDRALAGLSFDALWVYNDYFGMSNYANGYCSGGIVDPYRYPKYSYYMFQSQRDPSVIMPGVSSGPMVFIANQWRTGSPDSVTVFSNCDTVALYLNGSLVASQKPNAGGATGNLEHAPFTFHISSYQAGTLVANGLIGGVVKATDTVRSPLATASKIVVRIDTANMKLQADGSDIAIAYASIVDANGTVMPTATTPITFSVTGPAVPITPDGNPVAAIGGIASAYIQTFYNTAGLITVSAAATGVTSGSATVGSVLPPPNAPVSVLHGAIRPDAIQAEIRMVQRGDRLSFTVPDALMRGSASARFMLYNLQGKLVRSWNFGRGAELSVSTGSCPQGIYSGRLVIGSSEYVRQVVKIGQ
jgi:beta-galactosidase